MICPKCGYTINENDAFCRACGNNVRPYMQNNQVEQPIQNNMNSQPSQDYNYHSQFQQPTNNVPSNDINNPGNNYYAELIDAYIGKNAAKIKSGKFSWPTFFFSTSYCMYRKMWILWIIWAIGSSVLTSIMPYIGGVISFIVTIIIAANFNKMYMDNVKENVNKIIQQNQGKTKDELKMICSKKGGTTIIPIIILLVVIIAIVAMAILSYNLIGNTMDLQTERVNCLNIGGIWENGKCITK